MTIVKLSPPGASTSRPSIGCQHSLELTGSPKSGSSHVVAFRRRQSLPSQSRRSVGSRVQPLPAASCSSAEMALASGAGSELVENQLVDRLGDRADTAVAVHEVDLAGMLAHPVRVVGDALDDDRLVDGAVGSWSGRSNSWRMDQTPDRVSPIRTVFVVPSVDIGDVHARVLIGHAIIVQTAIGIGRVLSGAVRACHR